MSTPGKAVAKKTPAQIILADYGPALALVMPKHVIPEAFMEFAKAQIHADPWLMEAAEKNPRTVILALRECAYLGHVPRKGTFDLVAFNSKDKQGRDLGKVCTGIEEYTAVIDRMYRAGAVTSVRCEVVRENDHFVWSPNRMRLPEHEFDALASDADRGPLKGVYAYAVMIDGATVSQVVVMGRGEVMKHKAVAKTKTFWEGNWEPDMWRKTALHKLEKYVPTSAEYRITQAASAVAAISGKFADAPAVEPGVGFDDDDAVHDAELVDDGPPPAPGPAEDAGWGDGIQVRRPPQGGA